MNLNRLIRLNLVLLALLLTQVAYGEEFRGNPKALVEVNPENKGGITTPLALGDVLFIAQEDPFAFLEGVELEIRPPASALAEPFAVGLTIHHSDEGYPGPGATQLSGDLLLQEELRPLQRFFYRIPLRSGVSFAGQADTRVLRSAVAISGARPVMISFFPRMKGLPQAIYDDAFEVTARPVLADRGGARVELLRERTGTTLSGEEEGVTLMINGEEVPSTEEIHFLPSGLHRVRVDSDRFRPAEATFAVERGEITPVRVTLQSLTTQVRFTLPEEVTLYLNGNPVDRSEGSTELPVGEHLVVMELGGFTVQRMITLEAGRSYELGLDLDVFLQEN